MFVIIILTHLVRLYHVVVQQLFLCVSRANRPQLPSSSFSLLFHSAASHRPPRHIIIIVVVVVIIIIAIIRQLDVSPTP